jgi:hypothetical protein
MHETKNYPHRKNNPSLICPLVIEDGAFEFISKKNLELINAKFFARIHLSVRCIGYF